MPKVITKQCNTCQARAATNSSGKAKCNGKSPCAWCKNRGIECSYSDEISNAPPADETPTAPTATSKQPETTMTLIDKADGSRSVKFHPDPENLGEIDATDASDFCLPGELPIDNYTALVNERKRKRIDNLTLFKVETAPSVGAKRLRGGVEDDVGDNDDDHNHPPPPPPPPQPDATLAQALNAIAASNAAMAASQAATQQMMAQFMERMDNGAIRRVGHLAPSIAIWHFILAIWHFIPAVWHSILAIWHLIPAIWHSIIAIWHRILAIWLSF